MYASTAAGRIDLARGGAAKEFTVHTRNGNTRVYAGLAVAFQTEMLLSSGDGPAPDRNGLVLERRDPATGRWAPAELRVADDVQPHRLVPPGAPSPATPRASNASACAPPPRAPPAPRR
ncbi:hypothetical protein [Streptomyces sp. NPDC000410]|uniref:hypothetical protein n=1 Tax=Streptomyces sp. NPDC000410 TaxID=3154254 RepID=UPI00332CA5E0